MLRSGWRKFLFITPLLLLVCVSGFTQVRANAYTYHIDSVTLRDESGSPKSSFSRGELVVVDTMVTNIMSYTYAAEPFLMIAKIEKSSVMWGYGSLKSSLLSGQSLSAAPGILIPSGAPTGSYTVTVYVWSDWAINSGYPIAASFSLSLTVT